VTTPEYAAVSVGSATITLSADDGAGSGVDYTKYILGPGDPTTATVETTYTAPVSVDVTGTYTMHFWSVDLVGNREATQTITFDVVDEPQPTEYTPVEGDDRFKTAVLASEEAFEAGSVETVVIATGMNWPDALGGAALAAAYEGPILLTAPDALPDAVTGEIGRLGASDAIILGGPKAVSEDVRSALQAQLGGTVDRIGGQNRYETAELIADAVTEELGEDFDGTAFVATGLNYPDALAASPLAASQGWPLYLAGPSGLSADTLSAMQGDGITDALILGGAGAVPAAVEGQLSGASIQSQRLKGGNRYATAVAIASYGVDNTSLHWDGLAIATGQNYPDALAGGVLQGRVGSVMLLTGSDSLPKETEAVLSAQRDSIANVTFLGGDKAVSQAVRDAVAALLH
jgi:putative cell wall-binding protein